MNNAEYLEMIKKADEKHINDNSIKIEEIVADAYYEEYRKIKALEIIAETLIDIRNLGIGSIEVYKDLVLDVHKLEKRIIKMEEEKSNG